MSSFARFLDANRAVRLQLNGQPPSAGIALIEAHQSHVFYLYSVLKIGVIFAHLQGLRPVLYPSVRGSRKQRAIIRSFSSVVVQSRLLFLRSALIALPKVVWRTARLRTKRQVVDIEIQGAKVGPFIFDAIYRPGMQQLNLAQRARIIYLLLCHDMDQRVLRNPEVRLVIIGDPGHRTGMLFALCRARNIRCINAINPDIFQMHKYYTPDEFTRHFREVPTALLDALADRPDVAPRVDRYLQQRFTGAVTQHDAVRAYSADKLTQSRTELIADYQLDPDLPMVFVMAHVLSDAPHTYPAMLYTDYEEWLERTVRSLERNRQVNFLVKEHPTADLYAESGHVRRVLTALGVEHRLLKNNVHTRTVLSTAAAIVTCGGTIGIEASVLGIPTVLAARPPYAGKGYTIEPATANEYETMLATAIQWLPPLTEAQVRRAKHVAYVMFELFDNDGRSLELGGVPHIWGQAYDEEAFYRSVIAESAVPVEQQRIYARLQQFESSPDTSMINYQKLLPETQHL